MQRTRRDVDISSKRGVGRVDSETVRGKEENDGLSPCKLHGKKRKGKKLPGERKVEPRLIDGRESCDFES